MRGSFRFDRWCYGEFAFHVWARMSSYAFWDRLCSFATYYRASSQSLSRKESFPVWCGQPPPLNYQSTPCSHASSSRWLTLRLTFAPCLGGPTFRSPHASQWVAVWRGWAMVRTKSYLMLHMCPHSIYMYILYVYVDAVLVVCASSYYYLRVLAGCASSFSLYRICIYI